MVEREEEGLTENPGTGNWTTMTGTTLREVRTFRDLQALSEAAAQEIVAIARASIAARGRFTIAICTFG